MGLVCSGQRMALGRHSCPHLEQHSLAMLPDMGLLMSVRFSGGHSRGDVLSRVPVHPVTADVILMRLWRDTFFISWPPLKTVWTLCPELRGACPELRGVQAP